MDKPQRLQEKWTQMLKWRLCLSHIFLFQSEQYEMECRHVLRTTAGTEQADDTVAWEVTSSWLQGDQDFYRDTSSQSQLQASS